VLIVNLILKKLIKSKYSNRPKRSRLPFSGNLVFGGKSNEKYD